MTLFSSAVAITLQHEGGYVDNPNDKGGPTNFGITQSDMPGVDMKTLTIERATTFYYQRYWNALYAQINDQAVCTKLFDMGVLFSVKTAVRLLQGVLEVPQDEVFGLGTLAALNGAPASLLPLYRVRLLIHARWIVSQDATQAEFLDGWDNRINS